MLFFKNIYINEDNHTYTLVEERTENQFWSSGKNRDCNNVMGPEV
jgi:hypothetical protein